MRGVREVEEIKPAFHFVEFIDVFAVGDRDVVRDLVDPSVDAVEEGWDHVIVRVRPFVVGVGARDVREGGVIIQHFDFVGVGGWDKFSAASPCEVVGRSSGVFVVGAGARVISAFYGSETFRDGLDNESHLFSEVGGDLGAKCKELFLRVSSYGGEDGIKGEFGFGPVTLAKNGEDRGRGSIRSLKCGRLRGSV